MILGNPDKFAIIIEVVSDWNIDQSFNNGVLIFSVDGKLYPGDEIVNATLNSELPHLKDCMSNVGIDERLFNLSKDEAFSEMYNLYSTEDWNVDADYCFDISPLSFTDDDCLIFAVSNGTETRILAASELKYIKAESRYSLDNIEISEAYVSVVEFNEILSKLNVQKKVSMAVEKQSEESVFATIEKITDKDSFVQFLNLLARDYATNQPEWENKSVIDFIKAMLSWTEDFSASPANNIDWEKVDYKTMAKILYMGKIYE